MQEESHIFLIAKDAHIHFAEQQQQQQRQQEKWNDSDSNSAWAQTILGTNDCDNATNCCDLMAMWVRAQMTDENDDKQSNGHTENRATKYSHIANTTYYYYYYLIYAGPNP